MGSDFIKGAVKHPGAATAAAKAEGLTVRAWAVKHQHDRGVTGKRARLALTLEGISARRSTRPADGLARAAAGR